MPLKVFWVILLCCSANTSHLEDNVILLLTWYQHRSFLFITEKGSHMDTFTWWVSYRCLIGIDFLTNLLHFLFTVELLKRLMNLDAPKCDRQIRVWERHGSECISANIPQPWWATSFSISIWPLVNKDCWCCHSTWCFCDVPDVYIGYKMVIYDGQENAQLATRL